MGTQQINLPRTDRVSSEPHVGLPSRKPLIRHAEVWHRGRSACDLMGWLNVEARGCRGVTTTCTYDVTRKGGDAESSPSPSIEWGRGGFRVMYQIKGLVMGKSGQARPLPPKIEKRLSDLVAMEEFDMEEVRYCRQTYWDDRDGWHQILINTHDRALERIGATK